MGNCIISRTTKGDGWFLQSGGVTLHGGTDWDLATITFPVAYIETPFVVVMQFGQQFTTTSPLPTIKDISSTGFKFGFHAYNPEQDRNYIWQALGRLW